MVDTQPAALDSGVSVFTAASPRSAPPSVRRRWSTYLRTVSLYALTLWAVVTLVFVLPRLLPGDPLQRLDDPTGGAFVYNADIRAKVSAYYGLDKPLVRQYGDYLSDLTRGDLGWSISQNGACR